MALANVENALRHEGSSLLTIILTVVCSETQPVEEAGGRKLFRVADHDKLLPLAMAPMATSGFN